MTQTPPSSFVFGREQRRGRGRCLHGRCRPGRLPRARLHRRPSLATAVFLALQLGRPLLLEGEAGVGKTELAKVLAATLGARLIRLQCYEGLDVNTAVYEWNYPRQMLEIRLLEARGEVEHGDAPTTSSGRVPDPAAAAPGARGDDGDAAGAAHRRDRPRGRGVRGVPARDPVGLPGHRPRDRHDPRRAPPRVILTSNRTREVHDALKRRCLYHWIDYPTAQKEFEIVLARVPDAPERARPRGRRVRPAAPRAPT